MKRLLYCIVCFYVCTSCSITNYALTGSYPSYTYSATTSQSSEEIWSKVIDWFFNTETPIALIDKASGIIISKSISLRSNSTSEVNGQPGNKNAYCVVPNVEQASRILGTLMIRVKTEGDKTKIQVSLGDLRCEYGNYAVVDIKSLGTFERQMLKHICQ